jgi:hypothetical protein
MSRVSHEVAGIPLEVFDEPIALGLENFARRSNYSVDFDANATGILVPAPEAFYSAQGTVGVSYNGREAGQLTIIAFAPGEGTGQAVESIDAYPNLSTGPYPYDSGIMPRDRSDILCEAALAIVSFALKRPDTSIINAGNLNVIGLDSGHERTTALFKIGEVGQHLTAFQKALRDPAAFEQTVQAQATQAMQAKQANQEPAEVFDPVPRFTVASTPSTRGDYEQRFGRRNAVYNPHPRVVQVFGFFAVNADPTEASLAVLENLEVEAPYFTEHEAIFRS